MNPDPHAQWEARIDGLLKDLPEMAAPGTLMDRVMASIERTSRAPWYRRPWQRWSALLQIASLALLLALFGALCFACWKGMHTDTAALALRNAAHWISSLATLVNAASLLLNSALVVMKQLSLGAIIACLLALSLASGLSLAAGRFYYRLACSK